MDFVTIFEDPASFVRLFSTFQVDESATTGKAEKKKALKAIRGDWQGQYELNGIHTHLWWPFHIRTGTKPSETAPVGVRLILLDAIQNFHIQRSLHFKLLRSKACE
jgi:hypothetical protein